MCEISLSGVKLVKLISLVSLVKPVTLVNLKLMSTLSMFRLLQLLATQCISTGQAGPLRFSGGQIYISYKDLSCWIEKEDNFTLPDRQKHVQVTNNFFFL